MPYIIKGSSKKMSQQLENVPVLTKILTCQLRGGVKIEKRENLGQCPHRGCSDPEREEKNGVETRNREGCRVWWNYRGFLRFIVVFCSRKLKNGKYSITNITMLSRPAASPCFLPPGWELGSTEERGSFFWPTEGSREGLGCHGSRLALPSCHPTTKGTRHGR